MRIEIIPCLQDNYSYLIIDESDNSACVIDPSEARPIISFVVNNNISLKYILNTHHHFDHIGGNEGIIEKTENIRDAPSINVRLGGMQLIIRGKRSGENPQHPSGIEHFDKFSSHNEWGVDHFAFTYNGDLQKYCENLREKGVRFNVEPWEFIPGFIICYVAAPDGVSIELIQSLAK